MRVLKFKQFVNESLNEAMSPLSFAAKYPGSVRMSNIEHEMMPAVKKAIDDFGWDGYLWWSDGDDGQRGNSTEAIVKDLNKNKIKHTVVKTPSGDYVLWGEGNFASTGPFTFKGRGSGSGSKPKESLYAHGKRDKTGEDSLSDEVANFFTGSIAKLFNKYGKNVNDNDDFMGTFRDKRDPYKIAFQLWPGFQNSKEGKGIAQGLWDIMGEYGIEPHITSEEVWKDSSWDSRPKRKDNEK